MSGKQREQAPRGADEREMSPEKIQRREQRLNKMQMDDLGTQRREYISTVDFKEKMNIRVDHRLLDMNRTYNQEGTAEHRAARENSDSINRWNSAWTTLKDDGTEDEELQDIGGGQTHRGTIAQSLAEDSASGEGAPGSHSHGGTRSTRGSMGGRGRGGGIIGTRGRGGRTIRVPRIPSSPAAMVESTPATFGIQDARHKGRGDTAGSSSRGKENIHKASRPTSAVVAGPSKVTNEKRTAQAPKPVPRPALQRANPIPFSLASPDQFLASTGRFGTQPTRAAPLTSVADASSTPEAPAAEKAKSRDPASHGIVINLPRVKSNQSAESKSKEKEADQVKSDEELALQLQAEWNNRNNKALELTDRDVAQKIQEELNDEFDDQSRGGPLGDGLFARQLQAEFDREEPKGATLTDFSDTAAAPVRRQSTNPDLMSSCGSDSASLESEVSPDKPSTTVPANQSSNLIDLEGLVFPTDGGAITTPVAPAPIVISLQPNTSLPGQMTELVPSWPSTMSPAVRDNPCVLAAYEACQAILAAAIDAQSASSPAIEAGSRNGTAAHEIATPPMTSNVLESVAIEPHRDTTVPASLLEETPAELTTAEPQHTPVNNSSIRSNCRPNVVRSNVPIIGEHILPGRSGTANQRALFNTGNLATRVSTDTTTQENGGQRDVSSGRGYLPYASSFSERRGVRIGPAGVLGEHQLPGGTVVLADGTWITSTGRRQVLNSVGDRVEVPDLVVAPPTPALSEEADLQQVIEGIKKLGLSDKPEDRQNQAKNPFAGPSQPSTPSTSTQVEHGEVQLSAPQKQNPFAAPAANQVAATQYLAVPPKKRVRVPDNAITRQYAQGDPNILQPHISMPGVTGSDSLVSTGGNGVVHYNTGNRQVSTLSSSGTTTYPSNDPGAAARAQYGGAAFTSNVTPRTSAQNASLSAIPPHLRSPSTSAPVTPAPSAPAPRPRSTLITNTTNQSGSIFGEHITKSALGRGNNPCRGN